MSVLRASRCRTMFLPSIVPVPEPGVRIPQSIRMMVDFPAPSGPTRPNISPERTSRSTPSTECTSPNDRESGVVTLTGPGNSAGVIRPDSRNKRVCRHPGFQHTPRVLDFDLYGERQFDAFLFRLDVFRRELRGRRN